MGVEARAAEVSMAGPCGRERLEPNPGGRSLGELGPAGGQTLCSAGGRASPGEAPAPSVQTPISSPHPFHGYFVLFFLLLGVAFQRGVLV